MANYKLLVDQLGSGDSSIVISDANPLPVSSSGSGAPVTKISRSGTIAAGGTSQLLMAENGSRKGMSLQNNSTGDLWIDEINANAVLSQPSQKIIAGQLYEAPVNGVPGTAIQIIGATTGQAFTGREW